MGKTYVSPSGTAKETQKIYVGNSNNVAQEIKRAYMGDSNGIARMVFGPPYGPTPILPDAYQQVLYIQSSGSQYINTGLKLTSTRRLNAKIQFPSNPPSTSNNYNGMSYVYSTSSTETNSRHEFYGYYHSSNASNRKLQVYSVLYSGTNHTEFTHKINVNTDINEFILDPKNKRIGINGSYTTQPSGYTWKFRTDNYGNHYIFAYNRRDINQSSSSPQYYCKQRLYSYKWFDNEELIRSFYPCYRKSDNVIGLYEIFTNTFFTNNGSGSFTKGEDHIEEL